MLSFTKPQISESDQKPIVLANQGFPYTNLPSDRRFEELVYSIYKQKIENEEHWKLLYDDINLMQGVGDKGRDCVLSHNKLIVAAIQCKKYNNRISRPDCIKEILKFVLYSFTDNRLIGNPGSFVYYFVASSGFTTPAVNTLDNFAEEILKESELEPWFNNLKKEYSTSFKDLDFLSLKDSLIKRLVSLKIKKITNQDLDVELGKTYNYNLLPVFFEVKTMIHTKDVIDKLNEVKSLVTDDTLPFSEDDIQKKFETASLQLNNYKDQLASIPDSHIKRHETDEIIKWLNRPLKEKLDPILLVVGNPGFGKTVILKDVYKHLLLSNTPVIAIKSDRYYISSITELIEKMNLEASPVDLIKKLRKTHDKIVVLIDQIDSLSQSVTSNRDYIDTYNQLINEVKSIQGVRIIVSIRTFDLNYDFEFSYFKRFESVTVKPLDSNQVKLILQKIGIDINKLSPGLSALLSIPNHLDVFCQVYNSGLNTDHIHTIQDLYNELWKQKITNSITITPEALSKSLYSIVEWLYRNQRLSIYEQAVNSGYLEGIPYLLSIGFLIKHDNELQFFHQSFYDYVFARSFVKKKEPLLKWIKQNHQTIYIRPAVKMILTFVRRNDLQEYTGLLKQLLLAKDIRYHLKLLIINQLGFEAEPSSQEIDFAKQYILNSNRYLIPFLESAIGEKWLSLLVNKNIMESLLHPKRSFSESLFTNNFFAKVISILKIDFTKFTNIYDLRKEQYSQLWFLILRRLLPGQRHLVTDYLLTITNNQENRSNILRLLHSVKVWDYYKIFELFEKNFEPGDQNWYDFINLLEDAAEYNYDWTIVKLQNFYSKYFPVTDQFNHSVDTHNRKQLLKKLLKLNPEKFFQFALQLVQNFIQEKYISGDEYNSEFKIDIAFASYDFDREYSTDKEMLYQYLINAAEELAKSKSPTFNAFLKDIEHESSISLVRVSLMALDTSADQYIDKIFSLLITLHNKGAFHGNDLKYLIRNLISKTYLQLTPSQKIQLNKVILNISSAKEIWKSRYGSKPKFISYYGHEKFEYLSSIPREEINKDPQLKKIFLELERKFGTAENKKPNQSRFYSIGPPLAEAAYDKMSLDEWENTFIQFFSDSTRNNSRFPDRGGLVENYRMFTSKVSEKPEFFVPLIDKIISENKVAHEYVIAGLSGLKEAKYPPDKFYILFKRAMKLPITGFNVRQFICLVNYLEKDRLIDKEIFEFICNVAVNDSDPQKVMNPDRPEYDILNSNRGAAVHQVVRCFYNPEFSEKIFTTLDLVSNDSIASVKISALEDLAVLMNIDKERTLQLFLKFIANETDEHVYRFSINAAQYLANYNFEALVPYFHKALEFQSMHEYTAQILAIAWLNNKSGSYSMLKQTWAVSDKAKSKMVDIAIYNYLDKNKAVRQKSFKLFTKFLTNTSKEVVHEYSTAFLHLKPNKFKDYLELLIEYSNSKVAVNDPHYYYEYLVKACKHYPKECLGLITKYKDYKKPNPFKGPYYDGNEPIQILIGSLNGLYEQQPKDFLEIKKAMDLFDEMLQVYFLRSVASKVLDIV